METIILGRGEIAIGMGYNAAPIMAAVFLGKLSNPLSIGELTKAKAVELVEIRFENLASINVLLEQLNRCKEYLNPENWPLELRFGS